jgi:hypothetical protein
MRKGGLIYSNETEADRWERAKAAGYPVGPRPTTAPETTPEPLHGTDLDDPRRVPVESGPATTGANELITATPEPQATPTPRTDEHLSDYGIFYRHCEIEKRVKAVYGITRDGPALMLPATPEAYDAMVEQAAKGIAKWRYCAPGSAPWESAKSALRAIGITRPRPQSKAKGST